MLSITVRGEESFDDSTQQFVYTDDFILELEHSLVSLSKWEETFEKPFLADTEKTDEETFAYIKAMVITPNVPPEVFDRLTNENIIEINEYLGKKMTATWFSEMPGAPKPRAKEVITAEVIYYWMIAMTIPSEYQYWHLNKLLTLIKVCNEKNAPKKKMGRKEWAEQKRLLNAQRKAELKTTG